MHTSGCQLKHLLIVLCCSNKQPNAEHIKRPHAQQTRNTPRQPTQASSYLVMHHNSSANMSGCNLPGLAPALALDPWGNSINVVLKIDKKRASAVSGNTSAPCT
jgi:hypothetical protein